MSKHTPGPWEIKDHGDPCYRYISAPEHIALAQVVWRVEEEDRSPSCEANAHLIAAAPELLEVLRWYAELAEDLIRYPWTVESTLAELRNDGGKRAKEVIAKAKGEDNE